MASWSKLRSSTRVVSTEKHTASTDRRYARRRSIRRDHRPRLLRLLDYLSISSFLSPCGPGDERWRLELAKLATMSHMDNHHGRRRVQVLATGIQRQVLRMMRSCFAPLIRKVFHLEVCTWQLPESIGWPAVTMRTQRFYCLCRFYRFFLPLLCWRVSRTSLIWERRHENKL